MERKGLFKLPFQILLYEIPKYLELNDYINYISTCKFLKTYYEQSDIWKRELNNKYTEEEILFAKDEKTFFEKYKKLVTQTIGYSYCDIAHKETHWQKKDDSILLVNVCWLHVIGKFGNVPDGHYVPEFKVKIARRPLGLDRLQFKATVIEKGIEPKKIEINENDSQEQRVIKQSIDENDQPTAVSIASSASSASSSSSQINNANSSNNRLSLINTALNLITLGKYRGNDAQSSETNHNNVNNDNNHNYQRVLMTTENKFNRNIIKQYNNDEWNIVECPEIIVDRSSIDPNKAKIIIELEIKDINGNWKHGLSFKGMRLRRVTSSDSDSNISNQ